MNKPKVTRTVNTYVEYHPRLSIIDVLKIKEKESEKLEL